MLDEKTRPAECQELLDCFEREWQAGNPVSIRKSLAALEEDTDLNRHRAVLHELIAIDLWHRWMRSSWQQSLETDELPARPHLDDYARIYHEAGPLAEMPAALIREEYRVRRMNGEAVALSDYQQRFAGRSDLLVALQEVELELTGEATARFHGRNGGPTSAPIGPAVIRCPFCQSDLETVGGKSSTLYCNSCGGSIRVVREQEDVAEADARDEIDHFKLLQPLGSGGFGTVWHARDTKLQRDVAIKLPRRGQLTPAEIELFLREARSAAQLRHPNIVAVYEVGLVDDVPYIVSELVHGEPLSEHLKRHRYSLREAARLCAKTAHALHHAHEAGVVHRDLKPANLILDESGEPRLTDFGLARREGVEATLTADGQIMGTPAYMSPEQARGESHDADRRSDVYSLGVILYEALTGERPFRGNANMVMLQIINDEPASPRKFVGKLPRDLETICLKCLEKKPASRYATAAELADDLERYLRGAPITARPIGPLERAWKLCRAHPMAASLVGSTMLFLSILVAGLAAWNIESSRLLGEVRRNETSAKMSYELALDGLRETITDVQESLQFVPAADTAREKITQQAIEKLHQLDEIDNRFGTTDHAAVEGHFGLGQILLKLGDTRRAREQFRQGHQLAETLARQNPDDMRLVQALGVSYGNLGDLAHQMGKAPEARKQYETAIEILKKVEPAPNDALSRMYGDLGFVCIEHHDPAKAREYLDLAFDLRTKLLAKKKPDDFHYQRGLWEVILYRGDAKLMLSNLPAALEDYRDAVRMAEASMQQTDEAGTLGPDDAATSYERLAAVLLKQYQAEEAGTLYDKALALRQRLTAQDPGNTRHQRALAMLHSQRGTMWLWLQNSNRASQEFQKAFDVNQELIAAWPENPLFLTDQQVSCLNLGRADDRRENYDAAVGWFDKGIELCQSLHAEQSLADQMTAAQMRIIFELEHDLCELKRRSVDEWEVVRAKRPDLVASLLQARAILLAKRGDFQQAESAADELAALPDNQPAALDFAAYGFGRLAELAGERLGAENHDGDLKAEQQRFTAKAMSLLNQADEAGVYQGPAAALCLRYSHGLESLHALPEFQQLLNKVASQSSRDGPGGVDSSQAGLAKP